MFTNTDDVAGERRRRATRMRRSALVAATALICAQGISVAATGGVAAAAGCISSGTESAINAALVGAGAQAALCPGALFSLNNPVTFTAPNQEIYTQGLPTDGTRATLRLTGSTVTTAINGNNQSGIVIENIDVDGNIAATGRLSGGALIEIGGAGQDQTVQHIHAHDTRSWSTLHIIEGAVTNNVPQCQGAQILDNQIGPAGYPAPNGAWADGISLACGNSTVKGNTVTDATDGGIVVFGAPGSTIENNTVVAVSRQLLGGINMVDYAPVNGNYTGTHVTDNVIDAQSAFIKVGLAMGPQAWNCATGTNYGATVTGNTLEGGDMGYGYAVNGVSDWTVTGNVDNSTHVGTPGSGCGGLPSPPAGFQYDSATSSTLQSQFQPASLEYLLGITAPAGSLASLSTSPTSLSFASQNVGTTSGAQSVTLTNNGSAAASLPSITANGDFAQSNTCGASLAANASCTVNVTFSPRGTGTRTGTLTISSDAANSPTTVALSGAGASTTGGVDATSTIQAEAFDAQSGVQTENTSDTGGGQDVGWIDNGDWLQYNNVDFGSSGLNSFTARLASGANAGIAGTVEVHLDSLTAPAIGSLTLAPTGGWQSWVTQAAPITPTTGTHTLYLTFASSQAADFGNINWFSFASNGSGGSASLSASPTSLTFASQNVGTTSGAQTVSVRNNGDAAASISSISAGGDFAQTNNCGASLAAGASCAVNVTFTPTTSGTRAGSLTITSDAANSPTNIGLSGTGAATGGGTTIDATSTIQAEDYDAQSGVQTENSTDIGGGQDVGWIDNGDWLQYDNVDFGSTGLSSFTARIASGANAGVTGTFQVRLDAVTNPVIATIDVSPTGGWQSWVTTTAAIAPITGIHAVFITFASSSGTEFGNLNWFTFGTTSTTNLALGKTMSASGHTQTYVAGNANDNNTTSYWESTDNAFPQWLQIDLGASTSVGRIVLTLPTSWGARTQTLSLLGSTDGSTFTTIVGPADHTFDPDTGNTVTITFNPTSTRYLRLNFTANTGWPAGQASEFEVFSS